MKAVESTPITPGGPQRLPAALQKGSKDKAFGELVTDYLEEVNRLQKEADKSVFDLATGRTESLQDVVVAVNEADLSFRLMMQIRNKLLDAYREIMRMQV